MICTTSCGKEEKGEINNTIFTDEFFEDVVTIQDLIGRVSGDQIKPVIKYLKSLYLVETDIYVKTVDEQGYPLMGSYSLQFVLKDSTLISYYRTKTIFVNVNGVNYMITDGDLDVGLERAFKQGGGELFLRHSYLRWAKSFHGNGEGFAGSYLQYNFLNN